MNRWPLSLAAALTVVAATVLAALPWGLPAELRLVPPLIPFLVLHYWTMRGVDRVPEVLVFAAGILLDVLSGGPAGYWALIYLAGYAISLAASMTVLAAHAVTRWLLLGITLAILSVVEVALAALYFNAAAAWSQPFVAALAATALYPLVVAPLRAIAGPHDAAPVSDLARSRAA